MIKAIDTYYKGNYFRSRLEARWAVFFDEVGIKYQYESVGFEIGQGYELPNGKKTINYLPDFYLPDFDAYLEIKPPVNVWSIAESNQFDRIKWGIFSTQKKLIVAFGNPGTDTWKFITAKGDEGQVFHVVPNKQNEKWILIFLTQLRDGEMIPFSGLTLLHICWKPFDKAIEIANKKRFENENKL